MDKETYEITSRAFLYENGVMSVLPVPSTEAYAGDINDSGVVVGTMRAAGGFLNFHAYVDADGVATDLNSLIPAGSGLHLAYGSAINNAGQIVGTAFDAQGVNTHTCSRPLHRARQSSALETRWSLRVMRALRR